MNEQHVRLARTTLIIALAGVFLYFGIDKFLQPLVWIGWIPQWMDGLMLPNSTWLRVFGAVEIVLGAMLLVPHAMLRKLACSVIILHLIAVLTQVGINDIGVRDAGLTLAAVSLWLLL